MKKTRPIFLTDGTRFALTEDGKFPDTWVRFVGTHLDYEVDTATGHLTGKRIQMLVYVNQHGFKENIRTDIDVWIIEDPSEEYQGEDKPKVAVFQTEGAEIVKGPDMMRLIAGYRHDDWKCYKDPKNGNWYCISGDETEMREYTYMGEVEA